MAKSKVAVENSKPNYYTFITPLYYMSKASGQWPQTLRRSSPGFTVTSVVYLFVVYIGIGYCIYVNSSVALWKQYLQQMESPILQYGLQAHIINGLIMGNVI